MDAFVVITTCVLLTMLIGFPILRLVEGMGKGKKK
jgi:hypothetical protein